MLPHEKLEVYRKALDFAATAAVKVAAGLDLAARKGSWESFSSEPGEALLERNIAMLSRM